MINKERLQPLLLIVPVFITLTAFIWTMYQKDVNFLFHVRYDHFTSARYFATEGFREGKIVPLQAEPGKKTSDYQDICETIHPSHFIGFPLLLTPIVSIFGDNIAPPTIFNIIISIVTIYVFFVFVSLFCSRLVSVISTLFFATNFNFLLLAASTYQQNCEILLILLMLLNLFRTKSLSQNPSAGPRPCERAGDEAGDAGSSIADAAQRRKRLLQPAEARKGFEIDSKSYPLMFFLFFLSSIMGPTSLTVAVILFIIMLTYKPVRTDDRSFALPLLFLLIIPLSAGFALHVLSTIDACGNIGLATILDSVARRTNVQDNAYQINLLSHDFYIKVFILNSVYCFGPSIYFLSIAFLFNLIDGHRSNAPQRLLFFLFVPPVLFLTAFYNVTYYHSYYYCFILAVPVAAAIELENMKNIRFRCFFILAHFISCIYFILKIHV